MVRLNSRISIILLSLLCILLVPCRSSAAAYDAYGEATTEYRAGRFERVIRILEGKKNKNSGDYNMLGWAYLRNSDPVKAADAFKESLVRKGRGNDSYCGYGFAMLHRQMNDEAADAFEKGLRDNPRYVDCLMGKATLYERLGNPKGARDLFAAILRIDPDHDYAKEKLKNVSDEMSPEREETRFSFATGGDYFEVIAEGQKPRTLFIKGVNLGFALPGHFPSEFPHDEAFYLDWFRLIADMNANSIRIYTLLPPAFYSALKKFNISRKEDEKLFLFQGVWVEPPGNSDFDGRPFLDEVALEIRHVVDAIHGRANIDHRYGRAFGVYTDDASRYVIGYIYGQEWEPDAVIAFNQRPGKNAFRGNYLAIRDGSPMEVWLTERLDDLVSYELETYGAQRPVAFMNWPPLDPLHHPTEATLREEVAILIGKGEQIDISKVNFSNAYDSDAVSLDEMKMKVINKKFRAGIFASSHVYPYYPDFLRYDEGYGRPGIDGRVNRYRGYLKDLKNHYRGIPLLVSEFGLPTSRGVGRFHPEGLHHGGLSEEEQAAGIEKMLASIHDTGCAGGIVFEFIDEWAKTSWMVKKNEENAPNWLNVENPEEHYGLIAVKPKRGIDKLTGENSAWKNAALLYAYHPGGDSVPGAGREGPGRLLKLYADYDEAYLYLRLDVGGPADWKRANYLIGLNTFGTAGGRIPPPPLEGEFPIGVDYVILLDGRNSRILVDGTYSEYTFVPSRKNVLGLSGYVENPGFRLEENRRGRYADIITVHRRRFGRDGKVFPEQFYNASRLEWKTSSNGSRYDLFYSEKEHFIEIRIPWHVLHVADPSRRRVILSEKERAVTEGIRMFAMSFRPAPAAGADTTAGTGKPVILNVLPDKPADIRTYSWPEWEHPDYVLVPKKSYGRLKSIFNELGNGTHIAPP